MDLAQSERSERFDFYEILLALLGALLLTASAYVYITDYPIGRFFFGADIFADRVHVGKLVNDGGNTRRKLNDQLEFKKILRGSDLFNLDTIVTGADASASLIFDDGSTLELAPKTMIRLLFEDRMTLRGIARATTVDVVAGEVRGIPKSSKFTIKTPEKKVNLANNAVVAAKPKLQEKPIIKPPVEIPKIEILSPLPNSSLAVSADSKRPIRPVSVSWKIFPAHQEMDVSLFKVGSKEGTRERERIFSQTVTTTQDLGSMRYEISRPGWYEWSFHSLSEIEFEGHRAVRFFVPKDFIGIETGQPLVDGEPVSSSRLKNNQVKRNFEIEIGWQPYPLAQGYRVEFFKSPTDSRPLFIRKSAGTRLVLSHDKVFDGKFYYSVSADLKNGFKVLSERKPFSFDFVAPLPVQPKSGTKISHQDYVSADEELFLTWEKTHFTQSYELQISHTIDFTGPTLQTTVLSDNFFLLKHLPPGTYYWRIRAITRELKSPYSKTQFFVLEK